MTAFLSFSSELFKTSSLSSSSVCFGPLVQNVLESSLGNRSFTQNRAKINPQKEANVDQNFITLGCDRGPAGPRTVPDESPSESRWVDSCP